MDILAIIFVVNIILKFFHLITWSWIAVLWPLWLILIIEILIWWNDLDLLGNLFKSYFD